jgi:hypothetical protein
VGKILYGHAKIEIDVEDRALAHLQIVIGLKIRRKESFFFSWREDTATGAGRGSIWIDPAVPLYFKYLKTGVPQINRDWIDALVRSSQSTGGLMFLEEPGVSTPAPSGRI